MAQPDSTTAPTDSVSFALPAPATATAPLAQSAARTAAAMASQNQGPAGPALLKVLTINVMFDSEEGVDKIARVIEELKPDLVGLQESNQSTSQLAERFGMHALQQDKRTALLSRFPIEKVTDHKYGIQVTLENGQKVGYCNAHLTSFPYQPHQLLHLPTGGGPYLNNEAQAIASAERTRGKEVRNMIADANSLNLPVIATGDFNEPSHKDWTEAAHAAGRHPIKCAWPGSRQWEAAGFKDSYREKYPDEMAHPGNTWTPNAAQDDPKEHHDRIDYVQYRGEGLKLKDIQIVGEKPEFADIVIEPWPTDHRALLATFEVAPT
ncbi:MAG: endonuclease/exonuclease/phosphatase family protein [Vulcanimicrobiota bacterium]